MKKLAYIITFFFFCNVNTLTADNNTIDNINGLFKANKNFHFPITDGQWEQVRSGYWQGWGLRQKITGIVRIENNELMELMEVYEGNLAGKWDHWINGWINDTIFKNKYDGCYERPEYYLVEFYRRGATYNCLVVRHMDVFKELQDPDSPHGKAAAAAYNNWLKNNPDVIIPGTMLESNHGYFSRLAGGIWYDFRHFINPKMIDAPINNSHSEDGSEYHRNNINNFPEHRKSMEKWISISSEKHKIFEDLVNAKSKHKLNLDNYIVKYEKNKKNNINNNMIEDLKNLNELYKSGALTKEEFEKAKKKLLN